MKYYSLAECLNSKCICTTCKHHKDNYHCCNNHPEFACTSDLSKIGDFISCSRISNISIVCDDYISIK